MTSLNLSIIEIIVLQIGAIILGVAIHFFLTSRKALKSSGEEAGKHLKSLEEWKLKFFNEMEQKDKELFEVKQLLSESEEEKNINTIEAEEQRLINRKLKAELDKLKDSPFVEKQDYLEELNQAQNNLKEQQNIINQLFEQIENVKKSEEKKNELLKNNNELFEQVSELKSLLFQKEKELEAVQKKENMSKEMTSMLDNAYSEFNNLQEKIQKLESDAGTVRILNMELADLKEAHIKMDNDYEEQKVKLNNLTTENQHLHTQLTDTEEKLKESAHQNRQLQKKVLYLEELNKDFHMIAEANKKLEVQIKQIGELESMLNVVSEERDNISRKQMNTE